jgi:hypothetical protein
MRPRVPILIVVLASISCVSACDRRARPAPARNVDLETAGRLVREEIFRENPRMNPDAVFALQEITTDEVRRELGLQVFKVTERATTLHYESYLVRDGRARRIAKGIGGKGVSSMLAADLDGDGRKELVFSCSWGSGRHRSEVGALIEAEGGPTEVNAGRSFLDEDVTVRMADGAAGVYRGDLLLGTLVLERGELRLRPAEGLPPDALPPELRPVSSPASGR